MQKKIIKINIKLYAKKMSLLPISAPNICQKDCQKEWQNKYQKECQKICQKDFQKEYSKISQKEYQEICKELFYQGSEIKLDIIIEPDLEFIYQDLHLCALNNSGNQSIIFGFFYFIYLGYFTKLFDTIKGNNRAISYLEKQ